MIALIARQVGADLRVFWREPASVGFTVALPVMFLVLFVSIFGNVETRVGTRIVDGATYYVPGILTLSITSAAFLNLAISVVIARERGVLKRARSTPLPPWVFMAGRVGTAILVAVGLAVVVSALAAVLYGVELPTTTLPAALLTLIVGAAAFAALGLLVTAAIPSEDSAPPITNVIVLPLYFISGIFVPAEQLPSVLVTVAGVFPVKPLFDAMLASFAPSGGSGFAWADLAVLAAWGAGGGLLATRLFTWTPRRE